MDGKILVPLDGSEREAGLCWRRGSDSERNTSRTVPDPMITWSPVLPENIRNPFAPKLRFEDKEERLPADLVVLAAGARPDDSLYRALVDAHAAPEIRNIGDSYSVGRVLEATRAAYATATAL